MKKRKEQKNQRKKEQKQERENRSVCSSQTQTSSYNERKWTERTGWETKPGRLDLVKPETMRHKSKGRLRAEGREADTQGLP